MSSLFELFVVTLILALPFLYETNKVFRYYLKFFVYYGVVLVNSLLVLPIMAWRPQDVKNLILASSMCRFISGLVGLKWELRGQDLLEKQQACVIVANHQSSLDILGMFEMWPVMEKCTVVAKKELFYAWPFGLAAWLCGLIFIDRLNTDQARQTINKATLNLKEKQIKMWVFPEGTRHNTGTIMPFKKGAFHVAIMGQIPVLPVVFSSYYFLNSETKEFNPGRIIVTALPPISTKSLTPQDVESLMNRTRESMLDVFDKTSAEVLTSTLPTPMYQ